MKKDILRNIEDLTPEVINKIKVWVKGLTAEDFKDCKYNPILKNAVEVLKKLQTVQTLGDVIFFGKADREKVIRFNEIFIVDSKYAKGDLCICQHVKGKKGHKVLHKIADKADYKNYCSGYFAVPLLD